MSSPAPGLLDTSVFVGSESGRHVDENRLPDLSVISSITVGELHAGVLAAEDVATQVKRMDTLFRVSRIRRLPVDDDVARAWAALRIQLARAGCRANENDLWIAATAAAHGLALYTRDADFDVIAEVGGVEVIRV